MIRRHIDALRSHLLRGYALWASRALSISRDPRRRRRALYIGGIALAVVLLLYLLFLHPPKNFPTDTLITIPKGASLQSIADDLAQRHVVSSPLMLRGLIILAGGEGTVFAGDYLFHEKRTAIGVARALLTGSFGLELVRVTIPEGTSVAEMATLLTGKLAHFNGREFLERGARFEGYLFPDTYYFLENISPETAIHTMRNAFEINTKPILAELASSTRSLSDIIIMASLIEKEAHSEKERRMISGILWNRLDQGIRLQVDAVFPYLIGKNTFEVTKEDLAYDSPYNTYKYQGLPPGPITNPGLSAIKAALNPEKSKYLFYLTGQDGRFYYATTFEGHKRNRELYLD